MKFLYYINELVIKIDSALGDNSEILENSFEYSLVSFLAFSRVSSISSNNRSIISVGHRMQSYVRLSSLTVIPRRSFSTNGVQQQLRKVVIGGGSGFIGAALTKKLRSEGIEVDVISRSKEKGNLTWDDIKNNGLPPCDAVVNFAGKHILSLKRRWTQEYKDEVISQNLSNHLTSDR